MAIFLLKWCFSLLISLHPLRQWKIPSALFSSCQSPFCFKIVTISCKKQLFNFSASKRHIFWWKCEFYVIFTFLRHFRILIKIWVAKRQFPAGWNSLKSHFEKIGLKRIVDLKTSFLWWKYKFFWWKCAFWSRSNYWYRHPRDFNVGNRVQVG